MKTLSFILIFSICALLGVTAHSFSQDVLVNISVYGNVPKSGYVPLENRKKLTIKEALELADFDISKLRTTVQPYPYVIDYYYIAERTPDQRLPLRDNLNGSLKTEVSLGVSIHVIDLRIWLQKLDELEAKIEPNWTKSPPMAYYYLTKFCSLKNQIASYQDPSFKIDYRKTKKELFAGLSPENQEAVRLQVFNSVIEIEKRGCREAVKNGSRANHDKVAHIFMSQHLDWITEDVEK